MLSQLQTIGRSVAAFAGTALAQARLNGQFAQEADATAVQLDAGDGDSDPALSASQHVVVDEKPTAENVAQLADADAADAEAMLELSTRAPAAGESDEPPVPQGFDATGAVARSIPFPELKPSEARIGMSACLLGHEVRYNKGHCHVRQITTLLGTVFKFVPVCPELDIGLGVPRPTLRLVGDGRALRSDMDIEELGSITQLYCPETGDDHTARMVSYAAAKVAELRAVGCDGFVLKSGSPSCGLDRIKIYQSRDEKAPGRSLYKGIFARELMTRWPELPVTDEGRLNDEDARDNFVRQVLCHHQWRILDGTFSSVVKFHETHKFVLLAQDPNLLKELGRFLAKGKAHFLANDGMNFYYRNFFLALKVFVGRGRHVNVLQRICGYIRNDADPELYASVQGSIDDYRDGLVPLVVPLTLLQVITRSMPTDDARQETKKTLLEASQYIRGAPRSLKAHTAISARTVSKLPANR